MFVHAEMHCPNQPSAEGPGMSSDRQFQEIAYRAQQRTKNDIVTELVRRLHLSFNLTYLARYRTKSKKLGLKIRSGG